MKWLMHSSFVFLVTSACADWTDTQNPEAFVLSYTGLSPFPDDAQLSALRNPDPDLAGEGCKRVLTPAEAAKFNNLLQDGRPTLAIETSDGLLLAEQVTLAHAYTVVIKAPDDRFAGLIAATTTRDFDGHLYEISRADYFRIEFAAFELLAAKGCGPSYEDEIERGLTIPAWALAG